jgi:hypothetical protein
MIYQSLLTFAFFDCQFFWGTDRLLHVQSFGNVIMM